ncbi:MAG: MATE family efflux transporter [Eubacteriales bacterium]
MKENNKSIKLEKNNHSHVVENKMGVMPISRLMVSLAWPAMLSMLIQALYNIVDSMFVGMISEAALSAITLIFPIQMFLIAVAIGTGAGVGSLISRKLGAKNYEEANSVASHGFFLSFINWAFFAVLGLVFAGVFMNLYDVSDYIIKNGALYLQIVLTGSVFVFVEVNNEKILQSIGNTLMPMIASLIGAVTNIILDPVFIFGFGVVPEMGVVGAAVATVIGQFVSMCMGLYLIFCHKHEVQIKIKGFKFKKDILKQIYIVGGPAILMQTVSSIMLFILNSIIATSQTAVAVFGSYFRLQSFIFMPVFGLNQGAMPIIGYNFGARNKERLIKAYKTGLAFSMSIMAAGMLVFFAVPQKLLYIFSASDAMIEMGVPALRILSTCFIPAGFGIMSSATFQATGHGILSMWQSLVRQILVISPVAFILVKFWGISYVWWAFPISEVIGVLFTILLLKRLYKKEIAILS